MAVEAQELDQRCGDRRLILYQEDPPVADDATGLDHTLDCACISGAVSSALGRPGSVEGQALRARHTIVAILAVEVTAYEQARAATPSSRAWASWSA